MKNNQEKEVVNAEFEIIQASIVPAKTDVSGVNLFRPENKEKLIQAFINTEASNYSILLTAEAKKKVKESSKLVIKDKDDKEGFETMQKKYREFVKIRTSTEAERKSIVEPYVKIKNGIDEVGKNILAFFDAEEKRMKGEIDQFKKWEQEEVERIEREAEEKLQNRIKELQAVGIEFDGSFYSIGESISVDVFTVKEFTDEVFEEFKKRVSDVNDVLVLEASEKSLHNSRTEDLRNYWSFLTEEQKNTNFGKLGVDEFDEIIIFGKTEKDKFEETKLKQEEEAKQQAEERKALNYEKRSFQLEKEGFEEREKGNWAFVTESGSVGADKGWLETADKEEWESSFENMKFKKAEYLKASEELDEQRKQKAEADAKKKADEEAEKEFYNKWNSRILSFKKLGFEHLGSILKFDSIEINVNDFKEIANEEFSDMLIDATKQKAKIEKEIAEKEEAERLQKLPEIEKAERYIEEVMKVKIPQVNGSEIAEILSEFKNKIKLASDEATSNLKNL